MPRHDMLVREFLLDALAPLHLDTGILVDRTVAELYKIVAEAPIANSHYLQLSVRKRVDRGRLAYVLWDTLTSEGCPRDPKDIAIILETTTAHMRRAERELGRQPSNSRLDQYVNRIGGELGAPHWTIEAVKRACWHESHRMNTPEHLVGAIFLELSKTVSSNRPSLRETLGDVLSIGNIITVVHCQPRRLTRLAGTLSVSTTQSLIDSIDKRLYMQSV